MSMYDWHATLPGTTGWRRCHLADGRPKKLYATREAADVAARAINTRDRHFPVAVYWCEREGGWHVGRAAA